jgi:hypothetical protein
MVWRPRLVTGNHHPFIVFVPGGEALAERHLSLPSGLGDGARGRCVRQGERS